ncbi:MAG: SDR family oxidoreductase [Dehalococcoidia bacterium]|nr:SDR family oxidoreductase [Dehalococcoidia bacterium]
MSNSKPLEGKTAVVTGSTKGIGRAIAEALAKSGARVVICSRNEAEVARVVAELKGQGLAVSGTRCDVSISRDLQALLDHAIQTWGRVDIWVNNAGVTGGFRPLTALSEAEIDQIIAINYIGTLKACRMVIPYFTKQGGGIIFNMTGRGGKGEASPMMTTYASTKAAIVSLTRSLAKENSRHPVSIHVISPGMVRTDIFKTGRPEELPRSTEYIFRAIGVPAEAVGKMVANAAVQKPGRTTGKTYSALSGWRLVRGMGLLTWYRLTGKLKQSHR